MCDIQKQKILCAMRKSSSGIILTMYHWRQTAGLERGRVAAQGLGESQPVADNTTAAGRAKNRRVEIVVADQQ